MIGEKCLFVLQDLDTTPLEGISADKDSAIRIFEYVFQKTVMDILPLPFPFVNKEPGTFASARAYPSFAKQLDQKIYLSSSTCGRSSDFVAGFV